MPSVYNYRHVELDKVGRGKRAIQPPGGQTADIFGRASFAGEQNFSSASSQAGSDVGSSSRVHIETDQQSIASSAAQMPADGPMGKQQQQQQQARSSSSVSDGQMSPTGSLGSSSLASSSASGASPVAPPSMSQQQQQLLMAEHAAYKPQEGAAASVVAAAAAAAALEASRTPKKTIPVLRRNPITGEILGSPNGGLNGAVVRVRQPPGGRSSGIF